MASPARLLVLLSLAAGLPGCGEALEDSFSCWLICPLDDGPVEIDVETASDLDPSLVRMGVFAASPRVADAEAAPPSLDVLVSLDGKIKLEPGGDGLRAYEFTPVLSNPIDDGAVEAEFPEARVGQYRFVVWYDADADGKLDLDLDGTSEFARAPSRRFDNDGFDSYLFDLRPYQADADENEDPDAPVPGSKWLLSADYCDRTGSECSYGSHAVGPEHLDGWTVSVDGPTM